MIDPTLLMMVLSLNVSPGETVALAPLSRGTILTADHIEGPDATALIGLALRRPIYTGKAISSADVAVPPLVERQQSVEVMFRRRGLVLSLTGRTLEDGAEGDLVRVMLDGRRRPVSGRVIGAGQVEVRP